MVLEEAILQSLLIVRLEMTRTLSKRKKIFYVCPRRNPGLEIPAEVVVVVVLVVVVKVVEVVVVVVAVVAVDVAVVVVGVVVNVVC